jgi:hypothetical protein
MENKTNSTDGEEEAFTFPKSMVVFLVVLLSLIAILSIAVLWLQGNQA